MREFIVRCKPDAVVPNRFEVKLQLVSNTGSRSERAFTIAAPSAAECLKSLPSLARGMEKIPEPKPAPMPTTSVVAGKEVELVEQTDGQ